MAAQARYWPETTDFGPRCLDRSKIGNPRKFWPVSGNSEFGLFSFSSSPPGKKEMSRNGIKKSRPLLLVYLLFVVRAFFAYI